MMMERLNLKRYCLISVTVLIVISQTHGAFENVTYTATSSPAYFSSPGYPTAYSDNLTYEVTISAGETEIINLEMTDCEIEYASAKVPFCQVDKLIIYDGQFDNATILYQGCCLTAVSNLQSTDRYMFLRFTSDTTVTARGFRAKYFNNITVETQSEDISAANLAYIGVALAVVLCIGVVLVVLFLIYKVKAKGKGQQKICPEDEEHGKYMEDEEFKPGPSKVEKKRSPPSPPDSPIPKPSPWRPNSGMQLDDSKFGPKKPDLLIFDKTFPDGSTKANKLPPVTEKKVSTDVDGQVDGHL
ncbi:hypothetical protein FSP39_016802 [Pinctada imbricata]|uniref:CUB domain-containing protein n=1 Tax=Pinctada imbricata TaxID=66713 RepID=A0AA89BZL2_PINIB|nr:hypothetical protein FSP39_016802 [Pinctada imbricata]